MRILLVIVQFPPDVNSTGMLMADLCDGLVKEGHEVSVITSFPHYEGFRIWPEYRRKLFQRDRYRGMDLLRLYLYAPGRKTMPNRLLSYLSFALMASGAGLLCRRSWDVVLCTNGSFFSGVAGWLIGTLRRVPFIYNVQDLYPDVPVAAGQLRNRHAIKILKWVELFMYRRARHITVISPAMRDNLRQKGVSQEKLSVVPNFVDTDFIRPLPRSNPFSAAKGLENKFVVMHAGNLGYVYDFDSLLQAAALLAGEREILFLIVGDGVARGDLEQTATKRQLKNVRFLPFQPRESLPWLRASADVQLSLHKTGSAKFSTPSKVYEIMASGRPLLASADPGSAVCEIVEQSRCGVWIEPERPGELAGAILELYRDRSLREMMGENGRRYAEQMLGKDVAIESYRRLIHQIAGKDSPQGSFQSISPQPSLVHSDLPRTTERPVGKRGDNCSEHARRAAHQSSGRMSVIRGLPPQR